MDYLARLNYFFVYESNEMGYLKINRNTVFQRHYRKPKKIFGNVNKIESYF